MAARILNIESRDREHFGQIASLSDFDYVEGQSIETQRVLTDRRISLYCLDDANKRAIFVELADEIDLARVPFVYQAQFDQAARLIAVPYAELHQCAAQTHRSSDHLILIFTPGRSGSTLLSNVLSESGVVYSLSEPDVFTQIVQMRAADGSRDGELAGLMRDSAGILFHATATTGMPARALKFRNQCLPGMDLFSMAFPRTTNIFLYRNPIDTIASFHRLVTTFWNDLDRVPLPYATGFLRSYFNWSEAQVEHYMEFLETQDGTIGLLEFTTLYWLILTDQYLQQIERGLSVRLVHYEHLISQPRNEVAELFSYCRLPADSVERALKAFDRDAQEGTALARDDPEQGNQLRFSPAEIAEINNILSRHPIVKSTEYAPPSSKETL